MTVHTRTPFTLGEAARMHGGRLVATHGHNCASHSGGACACDPRYRLVRTSQKRGR